MKPKLHSIKNVPIFEAGEWKGGKLKYSLERLKQIVASAGELKDRIKPYIILGHSSEEEMVNFSGQPSVGILENVRLVGKQILADFADIPEQVFRVLEGKGYRRWSVEIARDWVDSVTKKTHERVLTGLALLGVEHPAVNTLPDTIDGYASLYYSDELQFDHLESEMEIDEEIVSDVPIYNVNIITPGGDNMSENKEVEILQAKVDKLASDLKASEQANVVTSKDSLDRTEKLEAELKTAQDNLTERDNTDKTKRIDEFLHEMKEVGKMSKAQEDIFRENLHKADDFEAAFKSMKATFDSMPKDIIHDEELADQDLKDQPDAIKEKRLADRFCADMKHTGNKAPEDMTEVEEFASVFATHKAGDRSQHLVKARDNLRKEIESYL